MNNDSTNTPASTPPATPTASSSVDVMSMMFHQLSTPLSTIRWYSELLRMGKMTNPLDEKQAAIVDNILVGIGHMVDLVNGLHAISRLEQNKFDDEPASVAVADLIATAQNRHQAEIAAKNLHCSVVADQATPSLAARPSVVSLIIENLLSNAITYTPNDGAITITLRPASNEEVARTGQPAQAGIFLSIADTGYGIPANQQAQAFTKFFRGDNIASLGIEGIGLGLAGVQTAVLKLQGAVWLESAEGSGTTVFVVLPIHTENAAIPTQSAPVAGPDTNSAPS